MLFTFSFFPFISPSGAGEDVIYFINLHIFFLRKAIHSNRAMPMDTDTTGMNWKYPHGWFKPAGNSEEMGLATAMTLNCPSGTAHFPSSPLHHHSFFTSDPPAYRICIPWPTFPVLFSEQFSDEHTLLPKAGTAVSCLLFSMTHTDIRPTDSNLAGFIWAKEMATNKTASFILLFPSTFPLSPLLFTHVVVLYIFCAFWDISVLLNFSDSI